MKTTKDGHGNTTLTLAKRETYDYETSEAYRRQVRVTARTGLPAGRQCEISAHDGTVLEVVTSQARAS